MFRPKKRVFFYIFYKAKGAKAGGDHVRPLLAVAHAGPPFFFSFLFDKADLPIYCPHF